MENELSVEDLKEIRDMVVPLMTKLHSMRFDGKIPDKWKRRVIKMRDEINMRILEIELEEPGDDVKKN